MDEPSITGSTVPSWAGGPPRRDAALIALGFVSVGFFASLGGLVIANASVLMGGRRVWRRR
jgi:hypothetical protein